jgi:hypothetical protein
MTSLQNLGIQELVFLVLRLTAALGGFVVGYLLTGLVARGLFRLTFHRQMPRWSTVIVKFIGGVVVAVLIFIGLPLGFGGGGGGSGGGTGAGKGPFKGDQGDGMAKKPGTVEKPGLGHDIAGKAKMPEGLDTLVIEMLGPTTADGDKCFKIHRQGPPVNYEELEAFWNQSRARWSRVEIVLTRTSTSENDPAVDKLRKLVTSADDNKKRTIALVDESAK